MRLGILAIVSGVALSLSAAAFASEAQTENAQQASASNDEQKIVCHYQTHQGIVLAKPICASQYAWDKERRRQQRELADYQIRADSMPIR